MTNDPSQKIKNVMTSYCWKTTQVNTTHIAQLPRLTLIAETKVDFDGKKSQKRFFTEKATLPISTSFFGKKCFMSRCFMLYIRVDY